MLSATSASLYRVGTGVTSSLALFLSLLFISSTHVVVGMTAWLCPFVCCSISAPSVVILAAHDLLWHCLLFRVNLQPSYTSGVAKPGPTRAWAWASASGNSQTLYFRSIAICNDALFYALFTSLFARLAFNTGENLYCTHIC